MVTSVLLIVLGAVVYYLADQFPQVGGEGVTGPDLFPKALGNFAYLFKFIVTSYCDDKQRSRESVGLG